ncbi:MAG TPA: hypothetical protein VK638_50850, partial [Edaphobacter sp.]|nr:hypothetical protein [Edaphobacter sp.]
GYHGVVFLLPLKRATELATRIAAEIPSSTAVAVPACTAGARTLNSVLIAPLDVTGVDLPAEYRVLLYENLYNVLRTTRPSDSYLRTGDISAGPGCTALTLRQCHRIQERQPGSTSCDGSNRYVRRNHVHHV